MSHLLCLGFPGWSANDRFCLSLVISKVRNWDIAFQPCIAYLI